jgi:hypothetical protein
MAIAVPPAAMAANAAQSANRRRVEMRRRNFIDGLRGGNWDRAYADSLKKL